MSVFVHESVHRTRGRAAAFLSAILGIWAALPSAVLAGGECGGPPRLAVEAGSEVLVTLTGTVDEVDDDVVVVDIDELTAIRIEGDLAADGGVQIVGFLDRVEGCVRRTRAVHDVPLEPSGALVAVLDPGTYVLGVRARPGSPDVAVTYRLRIRALALAAEGS